MAEVAGRDIKENADGGLAPTIDVRTIG